MSIDDIINPKEYGILIGDKSKIINLKKDEVLQDGGSNSSHIANDEANEVLTGILKEVEAIDIQQQSRASEKSKKNDENSKIESTNNKTESENSKTKSENSKTKSKNSKTKSKNNKTESKNSKTESKNNKTESKNNTTENDGKRANNNYYINVIYPDGKFIKITADDSTNFQESKDLYHEKKKEYEYEALEVQLVGTSKDKEPNVLYTKKFDYNDIFSKITDTFDEFVVLEEKLKKQLELLDRESDILNNQKEEIEESIRNTSYDFTNVTNGIPNELIRLKNILNKISTTKQFLDVFGPLKACMAKTGDSMEDIKVFMENIKKHEEIDE